MLWLVFAIVVIVEIIMIIFAIIAIFQVDIIEHHADNIIVGSSQ